MFGNLLIIARCDVWCVGLGRLVVERWKEGRGGGGENRGYGQRWQSQLINTCVWLLEVSKVTVTLVTSLRREGVREATKTLL